MVVFQFAVRRKDLAIQGGLKPGPAYIISGASPRLPVPHSLVCIERVAIHNEDFLPLLLRPHSTAVIVFISFWLGNDVSIASQSFYI